MKILYAIQGTGNGHVSRAREIIPILKKYGQVDVLLSGTDNEVQINHPIKYQLHGLGFAFGKNGGVDILKTIRKAKIFRFLKDIYRLPVHDYDLVIHDIEPVTSWACWFKGKDFVEMSHQASFYSKKTPIVSGLHYGSLFLKWYVPRKKYVGFHFQAYDSFIKTPVIRSEIRFKNSRSGNFYLVYLPAYSNEKLLETLKQYPEKWIVFSKSTKEMVQMENVEFRPIDAEQFSEQLLGCKGLLTGAGFESPAEALYLGKKLFCIPMYNQYEQMCNAEALKRLGVDIAYNLEQLNEQLASWLASEQTIHIHFPDHLEQTIAEVMEMVDYNQP